MVLREKELEMAAQSSLSADVALREKAARTAGSASRADTCQFGIETEQQALTARRDEKVLSFDAFKRNLESKRGVDKTLSSPTDAIVGIDLPEPPISHAQYIENLEFRG